MNKLITTGLGGFPLELDDLRFQFDAHHEGIEAFARAFGTDYIVSGCTWTVPAPNFIDIAPGLVMIDGELFTFPGANMVPVATAFFPFVTGFVRDVSFDPAGSEVFEDGSLQDTYQLRRAAYTSSLVAPYVLIGGPRMPNRLAEMVAELLAPPQIGPWVPLTLINGWTAATPVEYRIEPGAIVRLRGRVVADVAISDNAFCALPVAARPEYNMRHTVLRYNGLLPDSIRYAYVLADGTMTIQVMPDTGDAFNLAAWPTWTHG